MGGIIMVKHDRVLEIQLGNNLRFLRKRTFREVLGRTNKLVLRPITQKELGQYLNVSTQQVQKYETINRIDSVKLYKLSKFFEVPMELFFSETLNQKQFTKLFKNKDVQPQPHNI
jgi:DNA-binding XRE family transcriptional regulator